VRTHCKRIARAETCEFPNDCDRRRAG
jgi:hypothetical protein